MAPWDEVMHKWKAGKLRSGGSGKRVRSQKQAIAIMESEKRKAKAGKSEYKSRRGSSRPGAHEVTLGHRRR